MCRLCQSNKNAPKSSDSSMTTLSALAFAIARESVCEKVQELFQLHQIAFHIQTIYKQHRNRQHNE